MAGDIMKYHMNLKLMKQAMMLTSRRDFLKISAATVMAATMTSSAFAEGVRSQKRPNVVFLFADQWRASAMGYSGDPNVKTPNLDRLAKESVNFETAVSVCPVCTPYRAALLTGRYPTTTGMFMNDIYLPDSELCMGEIYKTAGYDTAYIGKWHLDGHGRSSYIPPERRQGFDYWKVAECDHNYQKSHYYTGNSPEKKFWEGYDAFAQTKDAQQYIRDHAKGEKPFLLVVSYGIPHFPHNNAVKEYVDMYPPEKLKLAPNVPDEMRARVLKELPGYYAHCTALDKCIGDLVQSLQESGLSDNTLLVFTSDHGEMMGAQGIVPFTKQVPWDESCRVPFLLRYPAVHGKAGRVVKTSINTPDILPTLLGLSGVEIPKTIEGDDLSGLVKGGDEKPDRAALIMSVSPFTPATKEYRGIRTSRYTYVRNLEGPWLLYDNEADPCQKNNLAGKAEHADLQKKLDGQLQAELKKVGDDFKPRKYYLDKWGYKLGKGSHVSYDPGAEVQGPGMKK
jgi:arylsulfatase A-like enzyme